MRETDSVTKHVHNFHSILEQLASIGSPVDDEDAILSLMRSMPSGYKPYLTTLRRQPGLTLQGLIADFLQEEILLKKIGFGNDNMKALFVGKRPHPSYSQKKFGPYRSSFQDSKPMQREASSNKQSFDSYKKKVKCFYCKKVGHEIRDCRKRIADEKRQKASGQSNLVIDDNARLYVATALFTKEKDPVWYVDTGATQHMAHDRSSFINY